MRPGSGAGLVVIARADWLQRHATETAKSEERGQRREGARAEHGVHEKREMN